MSVNDRFDKKHEYMYTTAAEDVEAKRLAGHNMLHNPHTLQFLKPYIHGRKVILEIGCGSGQLAADVMSLADETAKFVGVDRDLAQIKRSSIALKEFEGRSKLVQLDLLSEFDLLRKMGPFDLIYCRWVLVHFPKDQLVNFLKNIIGLLAEGAVFLCDECDNRSVVFKPNNSGKTTAPYLEATELWSVLSLALMDDLKNDLELTAEKIIAKLQQAGGDSGNVRVEGQYQVTLRGKEQKKLIADGYRSSAAFFKSIGKPINEFIGVIDACVDDDSIEVPFLTENVVTFSKKR
jgi:SAM-dependent methyltransferase